MRESGEDLETWRAPNGQIIGSGERESEAEVRHRWSRVFKAIQLVISMTGFSLVIRRLKEFNRLEAAFKAPFNSCNINRSHVEGKSDV